MLYYVTVGFIHSHPSGLPKASQGETVYYFTYGSNLSKKEMKEYCPDSKPEFVATLHNYKLVFVGWSQRRQGGGASIKRFSGERVLGAIYDISERDLRELDKKEGYPQTYTRMNVTVTNEFSDRIEAVTYIKVGRLEETQASEEYKAVIRQGYKDWGIWPFHS